MNYGRYQVLNEQDSILGKGAMGVVYRAHDPRLNRNVAIKVLHKKLLYDDEAVKSFLKEATLNASLSHPNILTILDVGQEHGEVYIAMELLEGRPLSKIMVNLSQQEIVSIGMQIADGLDYAHKKKVVHRDIKPANIMVLNDGQIKITDFGIAKGGSASGEEHLETQTGVIKGTPAYMSPEQARGDSKSVDGRSDLFSLGVMLYEMSVGKRPFGGEGKDFMAVFAEILNKTPVEPCKANGAVGRDLSAAIMKSLQKDPARRFQSGSELMLALKSCLSAEIPQHGKSDGRLLMGGAAAGGVALLALGAFFLFSSGKKEVTEPPAPVAIAPAASPASPAMSAPATAAPALPGHSGEPKQSGQPEPAQGLQLPPPIPAGSQQASPARPQTTTPPATVEVRPTPAPGKVVERPKPPVRKTAERPKPAEKKAALPVVSRRTESLMAESEAASTGASTQYAFLKVGSTPSGAQVYINGTLKGMTPLKLRLNLGRYKVRLSRAGFKDVATSVMLDKMAEFPIVQELTPE